MLQKTPEKELTHSQRARYGKDKIKKALADLKEERTGPYEVNPNGICASNRQLLLLEALAMESEIKQAIAHKVDIL